MTEIETVDLQLLDELGPVPVELAYLRKGTETGELFAHLEGRGTIRHVNERTGGWFEVNRYTQHVNQFVAELASAFPGHIDAVYSPPTNRPDLPLPYRQAFARRCGPTDLTPRFLAPFDLRSRAPHQLSRYVRGTAYQPAGDEPSFKTILIVDDTFAGGEMIEATIVHLLRSGVAKSCAFKIACAWWSTARRPQSVTSAA